MMSQVVGLRALADSTVAKCYILDLDGLRLPSTDERLNYICLLRIHKGIPGVKRYQNQPSKLSSYKVAAYAECLWATPNSETNTQSCVSTEMWSFWEAMRWGG